MSSPVLKSRGGGQSITDWRAWTRPKQAYHWKAGRSAMELARAWFTAPEPRCPDEIEALLATHPRTKGIQFIEGCPEFETALPMRGGKRNHDLALWGDVNGQKVVVCVEAKADERFGEQTIGEYWHSAQSSGNPTRVPQRIMILLHMLFGPHAQPDCLPWSNLRYQLLTGMAGTAIQAVNDKADLAVFLVHEFRTHATTPAKIVLGSQDYSDFVGEFLSIPAATVQSGQIYGPKSLSASRYLPSHIDILVGKAVYHW